LRIKLAEWGSEVTVLTAGRSGYLLTMMCVRGPTRMSGSPKVAATHGSLSILLADSSHEDRMPRSRSQWWLAAEVFEITIARRNASETRKDRPVRTV